MIIPSIGIMQAFLYALKGDEAVKINPVLGISSLENMRENGLRDISDMAIPFPDAPLPKIAGGFEAQKLDHVYHAFYLATLRSFAGKSLRRMSIKLADIMEPLRNEKGLGKFYLACLDMEYPFCRPDLITTNSTNLLFWLNVTIDLVRHNIPEKNRLLAMRKIHEKFCIEGIGKEAGINEKGISELKSSIEYCLKFPTLNGYLRALFEMVSKQLSEFSKVSNPLPKIDPSIAFNEVLRRLKNRDEIVRKLEALTEKDKKIDELVVEIAKYNKESPLWKDEKVPYYALEALKRGKISQQQFGTLMVFWKGAKCYKNFIFFNSKEFVWPNECFRLGVSDLPFQLSENQKAIFLAKCRDLPDSEQHLLYITKDPPEGIRKAINNTNFHFFTSQGDLIIPSVGIMQALLYALKGDEAVKINPVLGISSLEDVRKNGLEDISDLAIPFPDAPLPETADGHKASKLDYVYHYFYHAVLRTFMGKNLRRDAIKLADLIEPMRKKKGIGRLWFSCLDMEYALCRPDVTSGFGEIPLFWMNVANDLGRLNIPENNKKLVMKKIVHRFAKKGEKGLFNAMKYYNNRPNKNDFDNRLSKQLNELYETYMSQRLPPALS